MKYILYFHGFLYFHSCEIQLLVSPAKQERHIGIRIPTCRSPQRNTFGFQSITLEGMPQFHLIFTEGSSRIRYRSCADPGIFVRGGGSRSALQKSSDNVFFVF